MSKQLLQYSVFHQVLFPPNLQATVDQGDFSLLRCVAYDPPQHLEIASTAVVVFDLETTGLNAQNDQIIEIGAQKIVAGEVVDEFSTLIAYARPLPQAIIAITGITDEMLVGKPPLAQVLEDFLTFIEGSILVAHNATFDLGFIKNSCKRIGVELSWPVLCTLKLSRQLLPDLSRKNLDTLADHFGLEFEARHRSIGDVKVTAKVLEELLAHEGAHLKVWQDLAPFTVV